MASFCRVSEVNGETERLPVGAAVEIQANHLEHHVKQIRAIRSEVGGV